MGPLIGKHTGIGTTNTFLLGPFSGMNEDHKDFSLDFCKFVFSKQLSFVEGIRQFRTRIRALHEQLHVTYKLLNKYTIDDLARIMIILLFFYNISSSTCQVSGRFPVFRRIRELREACSINPPRFVHYLFTKSTCGSVGVSKKKINGAQY